jgi:hypothetical protein
MAAFQDLIFDSRPGHPMGEQAKVFFPNGYGASIIRGPHSYGGSRGLYELAVLRGDADSFDLDYDRGASGSGGGVTMPTAHIRAEAPRPAPPANDDGIAAAELGFTDAARRAGHTATSIASDLMELDIMAARISALLEMLGADYRRLDFARHVPSGYGTYKGKFNAAWIAECLRETLELSPEAHQVLAARMRGAG